MTRNSILQFFGLLLMIICIIWLLVIWFNVRQGTSIHVDEWGRPIALLFVAFALIVPSFRRNL